MHSRLRTLVALALLLVALPFPLLARGAAAQQDGLVIEVPDGYQIEKVVDELTYPTALTWDDEGQMYVAEAGGAFLELDAPSRILRVDADSGETEAVVNLTEALGTVASVPGLFWHDGAFYVTHRDPDDRTGAVSRVTPDGEVTPIFSGIVDSQSEHQVNDVRLGPDGRMYVASGPGGNAAVMGIDNAPFIMRSPDVHTTPCEDIVLTGRNYVTPDFRSDDPADTVMTGAYVPFGTETTPGEEIEGTTKCGGAILAFDPESDDPEETLEVYAWGFRNVIGLTWDEDGTMYAGVNGYDIRGSRPVQDELDATYRVEEGAWYGWPDFSAAFEPLDDPTFDVPDSLQPPVLIEGEPQPKDQLGFVIDHEASGLEPPDDELIVGRHPWNSSPSMLDVAPESWGDLAGQLFVAEWGDLAPPTNPLRDEPVGYRVVRVDPESGDLKPFAQNAMPGPASEQMAMGMGLERPYDVKFGPDGAMYIVDYGVARINPASAGTPYEFPPQTGAIWRVTQEDDATPGATDADAEAEEEATPEEDEEDAIAEAEGTPAAGGNVVEVALNEFEIEMPRELSAGPTTFEVTNTGDIEHNFEIEGQGIEEEFEMNLEAGETKTLEVDLQPGTYEVYCPVANHEDLGMALELEVTE